ncbi:MAG TPA: hypothetical protein PLN21_09960 [Gemmatales bacterium]|nr:hypothetical protein [Gemmatales bacterium]
MQAVPYLTLGALAKRYPGLQVWQIRRLFERGLVPEPPRVAGLRIIPIDDVPKIVTALKNAGYLTRFAIERQAVQPC